MSKKHPTKIKIGFSYFKNTLASHCLLCMHQTASTVIQVEFFLSSTLKPFPVGTGELPTSAFTDPTHFIRTPL